jgi:uncharacterized protein (UPF0212 family)
MEPMKKSLVLVLFELLFLGLSVSAQTVSPVIVECGKKCSGAFSVTNNGLTPLAVTVEARSFSMDTQGHATYRTLDAAADLKLDEGSARIAPKGIHTFSYELKCSAVPCSVTLLSSMVVGRTADGIMVRVQLPHTVYACEKQKDCRKSVRAAAGITVN